MTITEMRVPLSASAVARAFLEGRAPEFLSVPGITRACIRTCAYGLQRFMSSTTIEWQKRWMLHVPRDPKFDEPDDGLLIRDDVTRTTDKKVMMHVRPDLPLLLEKNGVTLVDPWKSWIASCNYVREQCLVAAFTLAHALDRESPGLHAMEHMLHAENVSPSLFRVGIYDTGHVGFAKEHVDRNFVSLHLGSSHPGLYFRTADGVVAGAEPQDGEALAFPSQKLEDASGGKIRALVHGSKPCSTQVSRWFCVFFTQTISP